MFRGVLHHNAYQYIKTAESIKDGGGHLLSTFFLCSMEIPVNYAAFTSSDVRPAYSPGVMSFMKLVTFDPFRTLGCPHLQYLKPDQINLQLSIIEEADWVLFPDYADVNLLVHGLGKRIFPSLQSYVLGYDKVEMTRAFQLRFPCHVPQTIISSNLPLHRERIAEQMLFPFVAKIPRSTRGEGVFVIESEKEWREYCTRTDILYAQEKLDIDRDLRVVWIGDKVVHAYWRIAAADTFHNNVAHGGRIDTGGIPEPALQLVKSIATTFAIDYAGFDIAMTGNHPYVLEFNRLFGLEGLNRAGIKTGPYVFDYLGRVQQATAMVRSDTAA